MRRVLHIYFSLVFIISSLTIFCFFPEGIQASIICEAKASQTFSETKAEEMLLTDDLVPFIGIYNSDLKVSKSIKRKGTYKASALYRGDSDKYSTNYIYNQLPDAERKVWDELDRVCYTALMSSQSYDNHTLPAVASESLKTMEIYQLLQYFVYSNPQYFFIDRHFLYSEEGIALNLYSQFGDGTNRSEARNQIFSVADSILTTAVQYSTVEEKVRYLQNALCDMITYDHEAADNMSSIERYDQCIYSALVTKSTVCTGYSQAMCLLCNALDIDCYTITSSTHAWNRVRIYDNWYNIDVTWADQTRVVYRYYLKDDNTFQHSDSEKNNISHTPYKIWDGLVDACVMTSTNTTNYYTAPVPLTEPQKKTSTPSISISGNAVTIEGNQPGAKIYYTTDGTMPSCANSKSKRYVLPFSVGGNVTIRAVATSPANYDSEVAVKNVEAPPIENAIQKIILDQSILRLNRGDTSQLNATIIPEGAGNKKTLVD